MVIEEEVEAPADDEPDEVGDRDGAFVSWFTEHRWVVRVALVALAIAGFWLAGLAQERFLRVAAAAVRFDLRLWTATITPVVLAGVCFTAAIRYPWPAGGFAWSRLFLAGLALVPAMHLSLLRWSPQLGWSDPAFLFAYRWFDDGVTPAVGAVLAGVAIASGFGAGRLDDSATRDR
jgi:hypothetical protein